MKITLDERDLKFIEKVNSRLETRESQCLYLGTKERPYWLEIEITDIAKANNFVMAMNDPIAKKELDEKCGIGISAICYEKESVMCRRLKERIKKVLEE